ncbi:MAG: hypothetical protein JO290_00245, partial [Sphingomonadaceae bacterium]|nr:hypothetical protein [Sphingomonadaceae bacterium]
MATVQSSPAPIPTARAAETSAISYADAIDLALDAPLIIDATVRSATRLKPQEAPDAPLATARFYIEADVTALIRGPDAIPQRVAYLLDAPLDARGRPPALKKARVILFARPAPTG